MVLDQESYVAGFELQNPVRKGWIGQHVGVEGAGDVVVFSGVPLKSAHANLERVHTCAVVSQLLVAFLDLIKGVYLVLAVDREARKLTVEGDVVRILDRFEDEGQFLREVRLC